MSRVAKSLFPAKTSLLVKELGYSHVSTGDLLRNEIKKGTTLGFNYAYETTENFSGTHSIGIRLNL